MEKITTLGRQFYAIALLAYGVQFFIYAHSVAQLAPSWPAWLPGQPLPAFVVGALLIATGLALLLRRHARVAATLMGSLLLVWIVALNLPLIIANPNDIGARNNAAEAFAVCAGAWLAVGAMTHEKITRGTVWATGLAALDRFRPAGRFMLGSALVFFGLEHLQFDTFVATLVPAWIPGPLFWARFCGVALMAGGVGIAFRWPARWPGLLTGLMIFLFGLLVNAPRVSTRLHNPDEWTSLIHTFAWCGAALLSAGSPSRRNNSPEDVTP